MSQPTGNETADAFLEELDRRIAGTIGHDPPDSRERMKAMRPMLIAKIKADPEAFEQWFIEEGQFILLDDEPGSRVDITIASAIGRG